MNANSHIATTGISFALTLTSCVVWMPDARAGGYLFSNYPDRVLHPSGYDGRGGQLDIKVCIVPGTPNASAMSQPVQNNIATWNKRQSTSSNVRTVSLPSGRFDYESVLLHEMGHCLGLSHPNLGAVSNLSSAQSDSTVSNTGPNGRYDVDAGTDGLNGSSDDRRNDDINRHYFYPATNSPFSEQKVVDSSTYTQSLAALPFGDLYPANADRRVSATVRYAVPNTEAAMQQGTFNAEVQRTLGHDDVSTLRYGMSGLDAIQGTEDDYTVNLSYGGISASADCDINVSMDATKTGFAACQVSAEFVGDGISIVDANIYFDPNDSWYFNNQPPCNESIALSADVWKLVALPCQVGVSTPDTVRAVFGDDLGVSAYSRDWVVFGYEYTRQANGQMAGAYRELTLDDTLDATRGYWIITTDSGKSIEVQGEYNSQMDAALYIDEAGGRGFGWNLVGMPYRNPVTWADTVIVDAAGNPLSLSQSDPVEPGGTIVGSSGTVCSREGLPVTECKVAQFAFKYVESSGEYELLGPASGALDPFDAAWVFVAADDFKLRFPLPALDRTRP